MKNSSTPETPLAIERSPVAYPVVLAMIIAMMTVALPPVTAAAPASIASEVARLPGLRTFGEMLDRTRLGEMIERSDMTIVLFAFDDRAWKGLVEVIDGKSGMSMNEEQLGEIMRMHGAAFASDQLKVAGPEDLDAVRRTVLERGRVRTLSEGLLPVAARGRGAARVTDAHFLRDGRVVVLSIDAVIFPDSTFEKFFPDSTFDRAPVSGQVAFPDSTF